MELQETDYYDILVWPVPDSPTAYRGVKRSHPAFVESQPHEAPVNQAFYRFLDAIYGYGEGPGIGLSLAESIEAAKLFQAEGQNVEVIHVHLVQSDSAQKIRTRAGTGFLGFEVVIWFNFSLLQQFLEAPPAAALGHSPLLDFPDKPLCDLIRAYFAPRRNRFMLFEDWEDARLFADVIRAYNALEPNLFEPGLESRIDALCLTRVWPEPEAD